MVVMLVNQPQTYICGVRLLARCSFFRYQSLPITTVHNRTCHSVTNPFLT
jgi:hypothetical protein